MVLFCGGPCAAGAFDCGSGCAARCAGAGVHALVMEIDCIDVMDCCAAGADVAADDRPPLARAVR